MLLKRLFFIKVRCSTRLILFILFFVNSSASAVTLDVGVSLGSIAFEVKDVDGEKLLGEMKEDLGENIYIATRFKQNDGIRGTNWGYFMEFGFGSYNIHTQAVDEEIINLGTDVNGKYAYLTWVLYYKHHFNGDAYFAYGLGAGLGYLTADGDVKLTEEPGDPIINVEVSDFSVSAGLYAEYFRKKWFVRLAAYGPNYTEEPYQFGVSDARIILGHRFTW